MPLSRGLVHIVMLDVLALQVSTKYFYMIHNPPNHVLVGSETLIKTFIHLRAERHFKKFTCADDFSTHDAASYK